MKYLPGKSQNLIAVALMLGGCAQPRPETTLPALSPAAERARADADQIYTTCLLNAAHYMDDQKLDTARMAIVIAPMCYPQFKRFEAAATVGLDNRRRVAFDRTGDQLQLDRATDILRKIRSEAASANNRE